MLNARMRTEIDLNESEHFLKVNMDRFEIDASWIDFRVNSPK